MSIKRMVAVWGLSKHRNARALLLLLAIADFADEDGFAWPSQRTLASMTRTHHRNIPRVIEELRASGELLVLNRDRQRSNLYVVTLGLEREQIESALERAREMGATNTRDAIATIAHAITTTAPAITTTAPKTEVPSFQHEVPSFQHEVPSKATRGAIKGTSDPLDPSFDPSGNREDVSFLWKQILTDLRGSMAEGTFNVNLLDSKVVAAENGAWRVRLKSAMAVEWVSHRLRPMVERAVERYAPGVALEFVSKEGG